MTNETQALLSAIETLCGKKKAKLLRRLAKAAMEAERENERQLSSNPLYGRIDCIGGITYTDGTFPSTSTTHIYAGDSFSASADQAETYKIGTLPATPEGNALVDSLSSSRNGLT